MTEALPQATNHLEPTAHAAHHEQTFWELAATKAPDENMHYYLNCTIVSCALYILLHFAIHEVALRCFREYREDMDLRKRVEYRTYIVSPVHALLSVILSVTAMFWICGEGKTVFNDDHCFNTPRYIHIWALLNTCGYFIQDFFWIAFIVQGTTSLDYQTYAHHIIGALTFYQTLYFMDFMVVFGVMLLFTEISTIFVSIRWILYKHNYGDTMAYNVNGIIAFFTFLVFRLVY